MFRVGESPDSSEVDHVGGGMGGGDDEELTVFGDFDPDDPDFVAAAATSSSSGGGEVGTPPLPASRPRSRMSGSRNSSSSSLRRIASNNSIGRQLSENLRQLSFEQIMDSGYPQYAVANGEELPDCLNSVLMNSSKTLTRSDSTQCHSCGALWHQEQFSLDCDECSGAAMGRNCLRCEGECGEVWRRDVVSSHVFGRASWLGRCAFNQAIVASDQEDHEEEEHVMGGVHETTARMEKVAQKQLQNM